MLIVLRWAISAPWGSSYWVIALCKIYFFGLSSPDLWLSWLHICCMNLSWHKLIQIKFDFYWVWPDFTFVSFHSRVMPLWNLLGPVGYMYCWKLTVCLFKMNTFYELWRLTKKFNNMDCKNLFLFCIRSMKWPFYLFFRIFIRGGQKVWIDAFLVAVSKHLIAMEITVGFGEKFASLGLFLIICYFIEA